MTDPHRETLDRFLAAPHDVDRDGYRGGSYWAKVLSFGNELDSQPPDDIWRHRHGDSCDAGECIGKEWQ